jgi:hypothetical protein
MKGKIYLIILLFFIVVSCSQDKREFERTIEIGTIKAYESFINQYPDSKFLDLAQENLYDLKWKILRKNDDEVDYLLVLTEDNFDYNLTYSMSLRNKIINRLQDIYFPRIEREKINLSNIYLTLGMEKELRISISKLNKAKKLISCTNSLDIIQGISIYRSTATEGIIRLREEANF